MVASAANKAALRISFGPSICEMGFGDGQSDPREGVAAALETYFEDRLVEAVETVTGTGVGQLAQFMRDSLTNDLKYFHTPSTDRVRPLFQKYLGVDITSGWRWNMMEPASARTELNALAKKRGDIAHRSWRPTNGMPTKHAVSRDDLRSHIHFIRQPVLTTDAFLDKSAAG